MTRWSRWMLACALLIVCAGVAARFAGIFTDFFFDEIWSLRWGLGATGPMDVFTKFQFKHDNNHWLNSLFIHFCGRQDRYEVYRLLSLTTGILTLPLAWLLGRKHGRAAGVLAVVLFAACYQFIHYSSEARGYASMVFFAMAAWVFIDRFFDGRKWYDVIGFWACVALGLVSHITFVYALAGFLLMAAARVRNRRGLSDFVALAGIPVVFFVALWDESVRKMRIGGGPVYGVKRATVEYASHATGGPETIWFAVAGAAIVLALLYHQWKDAWLYAGVLLAPVALLLLREPKYLYGRYFLICTPFLLVMAARAFGDRRLRYPIGAAACLWLVGQTMLTARFMQEGRGRYDEALKYIVASSPELDTIRVSSGWQTDFRDRLMSGYYGPRQSKPVKYVPISAETDWIVCTPADDHSLPESVERCGHLFVKDRFFQITWYGTSCQVYRPDSAG